MQGIEEPGRPREVGPSGLGTRTHHRLDDADLGGQVCRRCPRHPRPGLDRTGQVPGTSPDPGETERGGGERRVGPRDDIEHARGPRRVDRLGREGKRELGGQFAGYGRVDPIEAVAGRVAPAGGEGEQPSVPVGAPLVRVLLRNGREQRLRTITPAGLQPGAGQP